MPLDDEGPRVEYRVVQAVMGFRLLWAMGMEMYMWMWGVDVCVRVRVCGWVCTHDLLEGRHVGYLSSTERRDGAKERERMLRKDKLRKENEVCEIFLSRPWWLRWQVSIWVGGDGGSG